MTSEAEASFGDGGCGCCAVIFVAILFGWLLWGAGEDDHGAVVAKKPPSVQILPSQPSEAEVLAGFLGVAKTTGDSSWVPVNLRGPTSQHADFILKLVDGFKQQHLEWDVYEWKVERDANANQISGIWFLHRSKELLKPEKE